MTSRNEQFCQAFIRNKYNAKRAYLEVYKCTESNAETSSSRLMRQPEIRARIAELTRQIYEDQFITGERVASELAYIAFEKEDVKEADRLKALDLLQKQLGLQSQKLDATVKSNDIIISIQKEGESNEE